LGLFVEETEASTAVLTRIMQLAVAVYDQTT
jgi:hypothetical protein